MKDEITRLVLIRHGETEWNREERFRGRAELDLTETGVKQAKAIAKRVASFPVNAIYSSPLKRALRTAEIIAQALALPVKPAFELIDIDYGRWQGMSPQEAASKDKRLYQLWKETPHLAKFPRGESLNEVRQRVKAFLDYIKSNHSGEMVALISHLVVCRVMILHLLGWDNSYFWQIGQGLGAINIFELRSPFPAVMSLNDTCHLKSV